MFQVYNNIMIFPHGDCFLQGIRPQRNLFNGKVFFSAFIRIYIVYGMDPAQLLHVVVKQAVFSLICITVF